MHLIRLLRTMVRLCLVLAALVSMPATAEAQPGVRMVPPPNDGERYWPRWRGPSGQGVVDGSGYVDTWSETTNLRSECRPARIMIEFLKWPIS